MQNEFEQLKAILKKDSTFEKLVEMHHIFMKEYGWISLEEFRNLPMDTINNLAKQIQKENREEEKALSRIKRR
jgi:hypothetical protein